MPRKKIPDEPTGGKYFDPPKPNLTFFSSGCVLLDCVLGGGWALGRCSNVIGWSSVGKTQVLIEACANFARAFPDKKKFKIEHDETEAAFDDAYAEAIGYPTERVARPDHMIQTIQEFEKRFAAFLESVPEKGGGGLFTLDSLDPIGDNRERENDFGAASFGAEKAKLMSQFFRKHVREQEAKNVHLMIVSQLREKPGVMFGKKEGRSGGKALEFYCSQIIELHRGKRIPTTRQGVERVVGINVTAKMEKSKIGAPYRDCAFPILFNYGIDDLDASLVWLDEVKMLDRLGMKETEIKPYLKRLDAMESGQVAAEREKIAAVVRKAWADVEARFTPKRRKYE